MCFMRKNFFAKIFFENPIALWLNFMIRTITSQIQSKVWRTVKKIREFGRDRVQSHLLLTSGFHINITKYLRISSYIRKFFYDFASDASWISFTWGRFSLSMTLHPMHSEFPHTWGRFSPDFFSLICAKMFNVFNVVNSRHFVTSITVTK